MALYDVSTSEKKTNPVPVAGGTLYADSPIGTILPYGGASAPSGWFLCDGSAVSRTTYSELFSVIGTSFGVGDGSTTFNLPDMRESVPKGAGLTGHTVGAHLDADGLAVGEFLDDRLQQISLNVTNGNGGLGDRLSMGSGTILHTPLASTSEGFRYGATTEVKSVGVNYIIKAKMIGVPADFMSAVDEAVEEATVDAVTDGDMHAVSSNAVYDELYHGKQVIPYVGSGTLYAEVTGLYSSATHKTNVYMVTARNAEAYIMICGTGDNAGKVIPIIKQLSAGTSKLKFYWDADKKTVAISSGTYNKTYMQQISGDIAEFTFSDASTTNPLTDPTEITVS